MTEITLRKALITVLIIHLAILAIAQVPRENSELTQGKFKVGFRNYSKDDNTRSYKRLYAWDNKVLARPISVSIWYPAENVSANRKLKVRDYMTILKQEEEWESLPNDRILSWFYYADNDKNRKQFDLETKVYVNAKPTKRKFPVVIYALNIPESSDPGVRAIPT